MAAESLAVYLNRAQDFARGMGLMRDDPAYTQSAALLAIHSAIAYSDALRTGLGDAVLSSDDHQSALKTLRSLIDADEVSGLAQLQKLLTYKSAVSYGNRRMDVQRLKLLCTESQRFARWANTLGTAKILGWRFEDD